MAFTGNEGEVVSLRDAGSWTKNYRDQMGEGDPKGHFVGINKIEQVLNQEGVVGIRFYHAIDNNGQRNLVLVGVDADENDLVNGVIVDRTVICPPKCGSNNGLNS